MRRVAHEALVALRSVAANPDIRRIELARLVSTTSMFAYTVAFAVLAYRAGGAAGVGLLALVRMIPPALLSSVLAVLADRYPRRTVIVVGDVARAVVLGATVVAASADLGMTAVLVLAALISLTGVASGPARAALVPSLARSPDELAAANVIGTSTENVAGFVGPVLGGVLFAAAGPEVAFAASAVASLLSAAIVARVRREMPQARKDTPRGGLRREATAGFSTLVSNRPVLLVTIAYGAQTLATGVLGVLMIVSALEVLGFGEEGVGFVNSATSIGSLVGGVVALGFVAVRRQGLVLAAGLVAWGLPITVIGLFPEPALALALFAFVGLADAIVDVVGFTLLQRAIPDDVMARVFGALSTVLFAAYGLGALAAPLLIEVVGVRAALVTGGLAVPLVAVLGLPALRQLDVPPELGEIAQLLASVPMLAALPARTLEELAAEALERRVAAGEAVFREGDSGDRFYVVAGGTIELSTDGRTIAAAERGDYFGEIALLRDVPRTASARAATDARLVSVGREAFVGAVTRDDDATRAADEIVGVRMGRALRLATGAGRTS